ncbi:uncharacterized protein E5676_scaffold447G001340 [Cucumis melo var. makuwa]|uniref:Ubiquitin-like protease family profile domain-containing protein n=1 Tax=Cucumis melo var. makuwa TaxID=1194695 RepID=A0A5D3CCJ7_CUCMM|nr:uncharacterized protein E5676_scaffold447G001340 [Cucumis melo var. makuwa]
MLEGIEEKSKFEVEEKIKTVEVESMDKLKENEKKRKEERGLIKMPMEREVVCESTSTLPIALKSIFKYAEKVMEKDSNITFPLPVDIFGTCSSVLGSKENVRYCFVDSSLISSGNTQESRIRNLCSRLMVSTTNQVVLASFNPGSHWALLAINAYADIVFYLDSLRITSKATTRYVIDT